MKFRTKILLGTVNYTSSKVKDIVNSLRDDFQGERYHLLNHNCNCFSESLTFALLNKNIPSYVNRLANIGSSISCLIPKSLLGDSPVNESSASGGGAYRRIGNPHSRGGISMASLGTGMKLGGGDNSNRMTAVRTLLTCVPSVWPGFQMLPPTRVLETKEMPAYDSVLSHERTSNVSCVWDSTYDIVGPECVAYL